MHDIALIPSYEPTPEIVDLVHGLRVAGFDVVVVDDGSGKAYQGIFEGASEFAEILTLEENGGKGRALKFGLRHILETREGGVVVTVDGDGQHAVCDVTRCAAAAHRNPGALVLGCREFDGEVPARSRIGKSVSRVAYRVLAGVAVSDTQTGLRAFTMDVVPLLLSVSGKRYEYETNMLLECSNAGMRFEEVPIQTIYENGNACSHFRTMRDSALIYRQLFKFAGSSLACFCADYLLYCLLLVLLGPMGGMGAIAANILARLGSATLNYTLNRNFVFKSRESVARTALQYFALAGFILLCNTLTLALLVKALAVNPAVAKLLVEVLFFMVSWVVQRQLIFRKAGTRA